jgi:predicted lipase
MNDLKSKLHELIEKTNDNILLENIYQAMRHQVDVNKRDILDDLSPEQLSQLNESIAEYRSGKTKSHEEVLQLLKEWKSK